MTVLRRGPNKSGVTPVGSCAVRIPRKVDKRMESNSDNEWNSKLITNGIQSCVQSYSKLIFNRFN